MCLYLPQLRLGCSTWGNEVTFFRNSNFSRCQTRFSCSCFAVLFATWEQLKEVNRKADCAPSSPLRTWTEGCTFPLLFFEIIALLLLFNFSFQFSAKANVRKGWNGNFRIILLIKKKNNNPQESNIMIAAQPLRAPCGRSFRRPPLLCSNTKETICSPHLALYLTVLTLKLNSDKNGHKGERVSRKQFAAVLMRTACSWKPEITQFVRALSHSCLHNEVRRKKKKLFHLLSVEISKRDASFRSSLTNGQVLQGCRWDVENIPHQQSPELCHPQQLAGSAKGNGQAGSTLPCTKQDLRGCTGVSKYGSGKIQLLKVILLQLPPSCLSSKSYMLRAQSLTHTSATAVTSLLTGTAGRKDIPVNLLKYINRILAIYKFITFKTFLLKHHFSILFQEATAPQNSQPPFQVVQCGKWGRCTTRAAGGGTKRPSSPVSCPVSYWKKHPPRHLPLTCSLGEFFLILPTLITLRLLDSQRKKKRLETNFYQEQFLLMDNIEAGSQTGKTLTNLSPSGQMSGYEIWTHPNISVCQFKLFVHCHEKSPAAQSAGSRGGRVGMAKESKDSLDFQKQEELQFVKLVLTGKTGYVRHKGERTSHQRCQLLIVTFYRGTLSLRE